MGKGRIVTAHGEGRYTIQLLEDRARAETARTLAVERIASLDGRISDLEVDLADAQTEVDSAANAQDQAISAYQVEPTDETRAAMTQAGEAVINAAAKRDAIAGNLRTLKVERLALQRRIDLIDALPALRQQDAWCADYTPELSGEVATAEVPGEVGQVLVRPGYTGDETSGWPGPLQGGATWTASRDGALQPALSGTPASVFYNLAMTPGWQRWRPTFRLATISAISGDLCDITLDAATSSQQGLDVNAQASYAGVPIYYMECNGAVFEEGDRVLVAFSGNTEAPMVVGFEQSPRPCGPRYRGVLLMNAMDPEPSITEYVFDVDGTSCADAFIRVQNDPLSSRLGIDNPRIYAITSDAVATDAETDSGEEWSLEGQATAKVVDHEATTSTLSATYQEEYAADLKDGPELSVAVSISVSHSTIGTASMVCESSGSAYGAYATVTEFVESSVITIDTTTLDLASVGLRIAGANVRINATNEFFDPTAEFVAFVARDVSDIQADAHKILAEKDYRGVFYIETHISSLGRDVIYDSRSDIEAAVVDRVAAFMKAPDGQIFRVQAKTASPAQQLPDYGSLPVGIEQDEQGTWVAAY